MSGFSFDSKSSVLAPLLAAASMAFAPAVNAQEQPRSTEPMAALATAASFAPAAPVAQPSPRELYEIAMTLHALGDERGSFRAMKAAGKAGHPQAQRRLGEIYDSDTVVVRRNYKKSIRWYQRARAQGEIIPTQSPRSYGPWASLR